MAVTLAGLEGAGFRCVDAGVDGFGCGSARIAGNGPATYGSLGGCNCEMPVEPRGAAFDDFALFRLSAGSKPPHAARLPAMSHRCWTLAGIDDSHRSLTSTCHCCVPGSLDTRGGAVRSSLACRASAARAFTVGNRKRGLIPGRTLAGMGVPAVAASARSVAGPTDDHGPRGMPVLPVPTMIRSLLRDAAMLELLYAQELGGRTSGVGQSTTLDSERRLRQWLGMPAAQCAVWDTRGGGAAALALTGRPALLAPNSKAAVLGQSWGRIDARVVRQMRQPGDGDNDRAPCPHTLCDTLARHMVEGGAICGPSREILGHTSLATTQVIHTCRRRD